jgi:hypothetical protein
MDTELGRIIALFVFFGWIPILSIGKAISMIIVSIKGECCNCNKYEEDEEDEE